LKRREDANYSFKRIYADLLAPQVGLEPTTLRLTVEETVISP
jgi:hypothetical protein